MSRERADLIMGRDSFVTAGTPLLGFLLGGLLWRAYPGVVAEFSLVPDSRVDVVILGALVLAPAFLATWNDGLLGCWLLDVGPLVAIFMAKVVATTAAFSYGSLSVTIAVAAALAVVLGTLGFLIGLAGQRAAVRARSRMRRRSLG